MVERLSAAMHFARTDVFWDLGLFVGQSIAYFQPLDTTGVPTAPLLPFAAPVERPLSGKLTGSATAEMERFADESEVIDTSASPLKPGDKAGICQSDLISD